MTICIIITWQAVHSLAINLPKFTMKYILGLGEWVPMAT